MTKEEIKTLIDTKIAGQGTNVDGGGALATILNAIVEQGEPLRVEGSIFENNEDISEEAFLAAAGVSFEQVLNASAITDGNNTLYCAVRYISPNTAQANIIFGDVQLNSGSVLEILRTSERIVSVYYNEV